MDTPTEILNLDLPIAQRIAAECAAFLEVAQAKGVEIHFFKIWVAEDVAGKTEGEFQRGFAKGIPVTIKVVKRSDIFFEPYMVNEYPPLEFKD